MQHSLSYTSKNTKTAFSITVTDLEGPAEGEFWRYLYKVEATESGKKYMFACYFDKAIYPDKSGTDLAVLGDPLIFLECQHLDTFWDGKSDLTWNTGRGDGWDVVPIKG